MRSAQLTSVTLGLAIIAFAAGSAMVLAQAPIDRLPAGVLDVVPPSARIDGVPGSMRIRESGCPTGAVTDVRRRIVDLAVQEWAYFGFSIVDQVTVADDDGPGASGGRRFRRRRNLGETERTAASIAGYWAVSPGGDWILESQNEAWRRSDNGSARWRYHWSAAFISWIMCEGGLGSSAQFQRGIAHHTYIDQAIRARDRGASRAAFAAYDIGEAGVGVGDLLCSARRPVYRTVAERRRQMGEGASTHCDVVVKVDQLGGRILAIGGNVRGTVSLKLLPAERRDGEWRAVATGNRPLFAHLRLRTGPDADDAFDLSPVLRQVNCSPTSLTVTAHRAATDLLAPDVRRCFS